MNENLEQVTIHTEENFSRLTVRVGKLAEMLEFIAAEFGTKSSVWKLRRKSSTRMVELNRIINECLEVYLDPLPTKQNRKVSINGAIYGNSVEAAELLNVHRTTITRWINEQPDQCFYVVEDLDGE